MPGRVVHVFVEENAWRVELEGHTARIVHQRDLAFAFARGLAQEASHAEVRIHFPDGRSESEFYGEEPREPEAHARAQDAVRAHLDIDWIRQHRGGRGHGKAKR